MTIKPCKPYHAKCVAREPISMPDGKSTYKLYFLDIIGREERSRYEWKHAAKPISDFEIEFAGSGIEGIGFVTAFPHITKVFRFAPEVETVLHVSGIDTPSFSPLDLDRGGGWVEFACYAEALVAADEYRFWAAAEHVTDYLEQWSAFDEGSVASHDKLTRYWSGSAGE